MRSTSELRTQAAHLRGLATQPITYLKTAETLSLRSCYIFFGVFHLIYFGIDLWQHEAITQMIVAALETNSVTVTRLPILEHYASHKLFFSSSILSLQLVVFPLILLGTSTLYHLASRVPLSTLFKKNLLVGAFVPILFWNPFLIETAALLSIPLSAFVYFSMKQTKALKLVFILQTALHLLLIFLPFLIARFLLEAV